MGVKYDGLKLVWLKQFGSDQTLVSWVSPAEDIGSLAGGVKVIIPSTVRVINGPSAKFSLTSGALPTGLTLNTNTGVISGTVENEVGSFEYTLRATSNFVYADRTFTANVAENLPPVWITNAGSLGSSYDSTQVNIQLEAEDPEEQAVSFKIVAGSLPLGLSLNQNTGVISGSLTPVTDDTTFFFTIGASDGVQMTQRAFNYQTLFAPVPAWVSPSGLIGTQTELRNFTYTLQATGAHPITYSVVTGQLPGGLTLDGNTGVINGVVEAVALDKEYNFTVRAWDGVKGNNQNQKIKVLKDVPPVWISGGSLGQGFGGAYFSAAVAAYDPNGSTLTYTMANGSTLPGDVVLAQNGNMAGNLPEVESTTNYNFSIVVSDGNLTATRSFSINVLKNQEPVWDSANTINSVVEEMFFTRQLVAHDPAGVQPITYDFVSGTIPSGVDFFANGALRGTPISVSSDTDFVFTVEANNGVLASTKEFTLTVKNNVPPVWITNSGLISTVQGLSKYDYQLQATDPNGTPVVYTLQSGALPNGLSLSMNGAISGVVGNVATTTQYDFTVAANDGYNSPVTRQFSISVTKNERPVWITNAGVIGQAFETAPLTVQLQANDPEGKPIRYYLLEGNKLPTGMYLNGTTGVITGTIPHVAQDTTFTFNVWADDGTYASASRVLRQFQITGLFNSPPVWTTAANLGLAVEGLSYSKQLQATGVGNGPMIYSLESGALPVGLTLSSSGLISGILPAVASDTEYTFEVKAYNGIKSTNRTFTFTVAHNLAPVWSTNAGVIASQLGNVNFSYQLSAPDPNGQTVTYSLTNATALPFGVTMTPAGLISGVMNIVATNTQFDFDVRASDGVLATDRNFGIVTLAQAAPSWITPPGEIASVFKTTYYSDFVRAADPQGLPLTYSIISGALPNGLSLNASTGLIAGITPNVSNDTTYNFTIRVSDGAKFADRAFSFEVTAVSQPVWTTPAGSIGSVLSGYAAYFSMSATDPQGIPLTYNFISGTLPPNTSFFGGSNCFVRSPENGSVPVSSTDNTYTFTIEVTNGFVPVQRTFSITVNKNLAPVWDSPAAGDLGNAIENYPVTITFEAHDPENVGIYYVLNSGSFPGGLILNPNTGVLTGNTSSVPNTTVYNFTVDARDGVLRTSRSFSFTTLFSSPPIWVTPSGSLGSGLEQFPFSASVQATSDGDTIEYELANSTNLPSGLTLDANTGDITGTLQPVVSDTNYSFTIAARSTRTNKSSNRSFSINVINDLPPVWSNAAGSFLSDLAGTPFTKILQAVDPNGTPVTYVLANGSMPSGVTFDPNGAGHTAVVSGTLPTVANNTTYSFTVGASDGISQVNRTFSFTSQLDVAPVWTTNAGLIGSGAESTLFNVSVLATDPNGKTVTYSLDNGSSLPGSLTLNTANGRIFGVLPVANANAQITDSYPFGITASDGTQTTQRNFSINVTANQLPVWVTPSGSIGSVVEGQTFNFQFQATDPEGLGITYSLANSTMLPNGFTLYANGKVDGRAVSTQGDTQYNFEIRASDGVKFSDRSFNMTVLFDSTYYDAYSNSVTLLMNFEDPVGSNVVTDWFDHTISTVGNVAITNAHVQYGNSSVAVANAFSGTNYLVADRLPDFDFMNKSNWTVEMWVYPLDNTSVNYMAVEVPFSENNPNNWYWSIRKNGAVFEYGFGPGSVAVSMGSVIVGQWQHIAVSRNGSTVRTFHNGTLIGTNSHVTDTRINQNLQMVYNFNGYVDDFRVTNATRYTSNFTPGPAPKPPKWISAANTIVIDGTEGINVANAFPVALQMTDQSDRNVHNYNVVGNAIAGVTLDVANGTFSGTVPEATGSNYILNVQGKDGNNNLTSIRPFQIRANTSVAPAGLEFSWRFNSPIGATYFGPTVSPVVPTTTLSVPGAANFVAAPSPHGTDTALAMTSSCMLSAAGTGTSTRFLAGDQFTIEMWVYSSLNLNAQGGNARLFSVGGAASFFVGNALMWYSDGTRLKCTYFGSTIATPFPIIPQNQWVHLAMVRNGNMLTAYTNGVASTPVAIGAGPPSNYFDGQGVAVNGLYGTGGYSMSAVTVRGVNMWSTAKYTENFTPEWSSFLTPIWSTNAGSVATGYESANFAVRVEAKSFGNTTVTYTTNSGSMPAGVTLESNGYVYGNIQSFGNSASFNLVATDANGRKSSGRTFSLTSVSSAPIWVSNGTLGSNVSNAPVNIQLNVTDPLNAVPITYTLNSGTIPAGLTLLSNGLITGTLDMQTTDVTYNFRVDATNTSGKSSVSNTLTFAQYTDFDPYYSNVGVLLHADGNYTDNGNSVLTWSNSTTASVNAVVTRFGSGSFRFNTDPTNFQSPNAYVRSSTLSNSKYNLGTRDFTVEMWIYPTSLPFWTGRNYANNHVACLAHYGQPGGTNTTNTLGIYMTGDAPAGGQPSTQITAIGASGYYANGVSGSFGMNVGISASFNQWYHVALQRVNGVFQLYWNGTQVANTTASTGLVIPYNTSYVWNLGHLVSTTGYEYPFIGYMDDFRVTLDRARYTGNTITVPNKSFPNTGPITPEFSNSADLGYVLANDQISKQIVATPTTANATPITYSLVSGSLPGNSTLNSNGVISGMGANVSQITTDTFTIRATDAQSRRTDKEFTIKTDPTYDPSWANVGLLIHGEDPANGTVISDSRGLQTFTLYNASASTADMKFGNSSVYFTGVSTTAVSQSAINPAGVTFGLNDFTIEAWVKLEALSAVGGGQFRGTILANKTAAISASLGNIAWALYALGNSTSNVTGIVFEAYNVAGATLSTQQMAVNSFSLNTWHHVAISRSAGVTRIFFNGTAPNSYSGTVLANTSALAPQTGTTLQLGGINYTGFVGNWKGYMDEIRVSNGVGRYNSNFTVATDAFPSTQNPAPTWTANTVTVPANSAVSSQLVATSPVGRAITYTLVSGALANGTQLYSNGLISGFTDNVANTQDSIFTVQAGYPNSIYTSNQVITYSVTPNADQYLANVTALLPMTGTAGATPTEVLFNRTVTKIGAGGIISNATAKFGSTSMQTAIAGGANCLRVDGIPVMSGDFTCEGWVNWQTDGGTGYNIFFSSYNTSSGANNVIFYVQSAAQGNTLALYNPVGAGIIGSGGVLSKNTWNHVAWTRSGSTNTVWLNGQSVFTGAWTGTLGAGGGAAGRFYFGSYEYSAGTASHPFRGYMQDWRITNGISRYTGNFNPPASPYPQL